MEGNAAGFEGVSGSFFSTSSSSPPILMIFVCLLLSLSLSLSLPTSLPLSSSPHDDQSCFAVAEIVLMWRKNVNLVTVALYFLVCAARQRIPNRNPTNAKQLRRR